MNAILDAILAFSDWLWGLPMLIILVGGSMFLTIRLGFMQFRYFGFAMSETFGKLFARDTKGVGEGTVTPWQAASAAIASAIGAANIVGVPVAIALGGPGAVFWMWVIAFVGAGAKITEVALGVKYREVNEVGEYVGGPMYYLRKGIGGTAGKVLAVLFAFFLMIELVPSIATQSASVIGSAATLNIPGWLAGAVLTAIVGLVVFGGITRITQVTEKLVPFMAVLYVLAAFIVILVNITELPAAFATIFTSAFSGKAAVGGFAGATLAAAIRNGTARGVYSNESGLGTAPIAHSASQTDHPIRQSFWGIFENVVDTLIVCTMTALLVIITGAYIDLPAAEAASMPALAFGTVFGETLSGTVVTLGISLFVLSTVIVVVYYGEKQAEFLFGTKFSYVMRVVYVLAVFAGAFGTIEVLYQFLDIMLATLVIPNMIGLVLLSGEVRELKNDFFGNPKYYPKAKAK